MGLKWSDAYEIASQLYDDDPELDPLTLRFTELRDMVMALPDFEDQIENLNEKVLEGIQMAWLDEYQD